MTIVLINDTVKKYLLKQSRDLRKKIREKFEFLESCLWEGGLKVKKLKGISGKFIFEARLDRGKRILFTLGRGQMPENNLIIYVWGIVVHDDISVRSRTIIPNNAPFLQFENYQEIFLENVELDELDSSYFTQESITERSSDESGSQHWYIIDESEWQRIQMYSRDDFDLFLHLTPEQDQILGTPLPLIISGTAGSGKTSLAVYYLLNRNLNNKKKLFLTYNKHLKNFAVKLYTGLLNERTWRNEVTPPDFYTFKELCLEVAGEERFPPGKEVDFNSFSRLFTNYPNYQSYDSALVWEEISAIIKGASGLKHKALKELTRDGRNYLSFEEYEMLGKKKAPNFRFNRKDIYRIFEWYQNKLETGNLWDELDMISGITVGPKYTYDILVCDEVQDLTETQLDLLFNFVKNPRNIFLAGDTRQIINPSGFRWEGVRKHFYERNIEIPELKHLSFNFRSSGNIIELSNTLLELKEKYTERKVDESREKWKYKGRPVAVVTGIEVEGMLKILKAAGPERTILVRTEIEKNTLKNILQTELIFTIQEAKGLEFDTVVLWKFCDESSSEHGDVWKATLDLSDKNIHQARIKYEISLLYVGITRCRQDLIVYDGITPSPIWHSRLVKDNVYITSDRHYLEKVWNIISSPGEWIEQGHYFFERKHYKAAAECFKNGSDSINLARAMAYYYQEDGNYLESAANFAKIGEIEKAAVNYELTQKYKEALELWEKLNQKDKMAKCKAAILEAEGNFQEAGNLYLSIKNYNTAVECFKKARNYRTTAEIYFNHLDNIELAAQYYEYARDYDKAAALYAGLEIYDKAAELYFQAKKYTEAEMLWEKIGSTKNLLGLYHHTGSHDKIFNIYELENNVEKALKYLETLKIDNNQLIAEGEELLRNHRYFLALTHFLAVERGKFNAAQEPGPGTNVDSLSILRRKIADCYYKMGKYETSILYYQNIGDFYSAARIYSEMGDYVNTFCMYYDSDQDQLDGFAKARKALKKIPNKTFLRKIALDYYYHQDYKRAMFLFKYFKKGFKPLEGICYAISGKKKKAIKKWKQCNSYGEIIIIAEECLGNNLIETGAAFFLDFYFLQVSCHLENFDKALVGSSLVNLMNTYFAPLVDPENIGMDREHLASLKKEARAWGLFIAGHDEDYFQNSMTVHYYLAFCGEYNRLLIYFLKLLKWYPGQSIDIQEVAQRNSPQDRTVFEEEQLFQAILMEKVGKLMEKDRSNLDIYASKITLRKNNYLLLILAPVAEEYHKKAADWCKKNWCKDDLKQYLRLYAPERLKIFKKRSRQNDQKKEK